MRNMFRESNQIVQWITKKAINLNKTTILMLAFFKDTFQQSFKVEKTVFMKYVVVISEIILLHSLGFYNDKG